MTAPTLGTITTFAPPSSGNTGGSFSATIDAGANAALISFHGSNSSGLPSVTALSLDGVAATLITGASIVRSTFQKTETYYVFNPASGSKTVSITITPAARYVVGVVPVFNLDTSSAAAAFGTVATGTFGSGGASPSIVVSSATGELVVDFVTHSWPDTDSDTVGAGQTQIFNATCSTGGAGARGFSSWEAGAASVTMSWTKSGGNSGGCQLGFGMRGVASGFILPGHQIMMNTRNARHRASRW